MLVPRIREGTACETRPLPMAEGERTRALTVQIESGALRLDLPVSTWGGPGGGLPCDACTESVGLAEFEIETDFADGQTLRFHVHCFAAWLARVQARLPAAS